MKTKLSWLLFASVLAWGCADDTKPASNNDNNENNRADMSQDMPQNDTDADAGDTQVGIAVSPSPASLNIDTTLRLTLESVFESGATRPAFAKTWTSDATDVAEVTEDGVVIGHTIGTATISVSHEGFDATVDVRVVGAPVARIEIRPSTGAIAIGDEVKITVDLFDAQNAVIEDPRAILFESSDAAVLTVDPQGLVTAAAAGTAQITVEVENMTAVAEFSVPDVLVDSVTISPNSASFIWGDDGLQLVATIVYNGPTPPVEPTITWSSGDPSIVSVDATGFIQAVSGGQAGITATVGGESDGIPINVDDAFTGLSVGDAHACGLIQDRAVCWGDNSSGQLGWPSTTLPGRVPLPSGVAKIASGGAHTCALLDTGAIWCWGDDTQGQLGNGAGGSSSTPAPIDIAANSGFVDLALGSAHTCAQKGGDLYCWGAGIGGRIGDGGTTNRQLPVLIGAYRLAALGESHTCAVSANDSGSCWGVNTDGRLGNNTQTPMEASPTSVLGGYEFSFLSLGSQHSCGVTTGNALACWGDNSRYQVGDGTSTSRSTPILVSTTTALTRISVGDLHTCGLSAQGQAYCWGAFEAGLGQTAAADIQTPSAIDSTLRFFAIGAGQEFSCGLATGGLPYCWGDGDKGQLGGAPDSVTPVLIAPF